MAESGEQLRRAKAELELLTTRIADTEPYLLKYDAPFSSMRIEMLCELRDIESQIEFLELEDDSVPPRSRRSPDQNP
jgi:hypothetical protein